MNESQYEKAQDMIKFIDEQMAELKRDTSWLGRIFSFRYMHEMKCWREQRFRYELVILKGKK